MIEVGRFAIFGDWDNTPTPPDKYRINLPPLGHVEGTGWREVTQAALKELPFHIVPDCSFAEIGAGSGILSVAAKLLGAGKCYATEINPEALAAAKKVFSANNVEIELIEGTFIKEHVDVAMVSISSTFIKENYQLIKATKMIAVHDDATIEIGPPFNHEPATPKEPISAEVMDMVARVIAQMKADKKL